MAAYDPISGQATYNYAGGAFGSAVQPVPMPNPAAQLGAQIPGLPGLNTNASNFINSELMGQLSPDTKRAIQDASAAYAVKSGMPGSNVLPGTLAGNRTLRDIGLTSQQVQSQGLSDYSKFVPTVSGTQTVAPALQAEINTQNAVSAAAPDPGAAASYAEGLFNRYLSMLNQPHGAALNAAKPEEPLMLGEIQTDPQGNLVWGNRQVFGQLKKKGIL